MGDKRVAYLQKRLEEMGVPPANAADSRGGYWVVCLSQLMEKAASTSFASIENVLDSKV